MKPIHSAPALMLALTLAACSTVMPAPHSGFLSDYARLTAGKDEAESTFGAAVAIDPSRVQIKDIEWRVLAKAEVSADERATLMLQLKDGLDQARHLARQPGGRPVVIRSAITQVETVSTSLNTIGTLLLIGPLDRGGAMVEIEALDADTGKPLAALRLSYYPPLSEFKARFSKLAPAEIAVKKAATDFIALLGPERGGPD